MLSLWGAVEEVIYVYECQSCKTQIEVIQNYDEEPLKVSKCCDGELKRIIQPVVVQFNGSGFYCTDN